MISRSRRRKRQREETGREREREKNRERNAERARRIGASIIASRDPALIDPFNGKRRGVEARCRLSPLARQDICTCFSEKQVSRPVRRRAGAYVLSFFDHAGRIDACVFPARPRTLRGIILAVNRAVFHGRSQACSRSPRGPRTLFGIYFARRGRGQFVLRIRELRNALTR